MTSSDPKPEHPAHSGHEFSGAYARAAALAGGDPDWMNAKGADTTPGDHAELVAEVDDILAPIIAEHPDNKWFSVESIQSVWTSMLDSEATFLVDGPNLVRRLATALRTEQSARQAAEAKAEIAELTYQTIVEQYGPKREVARQMTEQRDALQARIDMAVAEYRSGLELTDAGTYAYTNPEATLDSMWMIVSPAESKEPDPKPWVYFDGQRRAQPLNQEAGNPYGTLWKFTPRPEFSQNPADYGIEAPHE